MPRSALIVPPVVGPGDRVVVEVTGGDRQDYLDDVLSQRLREVPVPSATSALELGPHGEPNGVFDLVVLDDRVLLLLREPGADEVIERLAGRTFMADATFTVRDDLRVLQVRGDADDVLAELPITTDPGGVVRDGDVMWLRWRHGADVIGTEDGLDQAREALVAAGATAGGVADVGAAEVATGVPRAPEEIAKGRLPEELGLLPTHVHLDKGCYPGQEAVARMWMLGRPRRLLAVVELPTGTGTGHLADEPGAVEVTRTARVGEQTVGLAFVGRDAVVGDEPHTGTRILQLVGAGLPVPGHDPTVKRRRDR